MSRRHDFNVRCLAVVRANARVLSDALDRAESALTQMEVGASNATARRAAEAVRHRVNDLETQLAALERLVCS